MGLKSLIRPEGSARELGEFALRQAALLPAAPHPSREVAAHLLLGPKPQVR